MSYLNCGCTNKEVHQETLEAAKVSIGKASLPPEIHENPLSVLQAIYEGLLVVDNKGILQKGTLI